MKIQSSLMVGKGKYSHFLHEHLLIYRNAVDKTWKKKLKCELCDEGIDHNGPYPYLYCEWCPDFALHNWCAYQPDEILHHPLHPQHKLELRHVKDVNLESHLVCEACFIGPSYGYEERGYCYICSECKIFIHVSCIPSTRRSNRSKKVLLKHACHPQHDLVLYQAKDINKHRDKLRFMYYRDCRFLNMYDDHDEWFCSWCEKSVTPCSVHEGVYACLFCRIYLHEKCAFKVPLQIKHPSHPAHTLRLRTKRYSNIEGSVCRLCNGYFRIGNVMDYGCGAAGCIWEIHGQCTSLLPSFEHKCREEHKLTYFTNGDFRGSFFCDECHLYEEDGLNGFYRCITCGINFHLSCILQNTVKHRYHWHWLLLMDSPKEDVLDQHFCDICEEERDPKQCVYSCNKCINCVSHIECAYLQEGPSYGKTPSQILQSLEVQDSNTAAVLGKGQITYPYHEHTLSLDDVTKLKRSNRYCKCCKELVVAGEAFICYECGEYCLHKKCSELPHLIQRSSLHHHPDHTLMLKFTYLRGLRYVCSVCGGVNDKDCPHYRCQDCDFILDIKCAFLNPHLYRGQRFRKSESFHFCWKSSSAQRK